MLLATVTAARAASAGSHRPTSEPSSLTPYNCHPRLRRPRLCRRPAATATSATPTSAAGRHVPVALQRARRVPRRPLRVPRRLIGRRLRGRRGGRRAAAAAAAERAAARAAPCGSHECSRHGRCEPSTGVRVRVRLARRRLQRAELPERLQRPRLPLARACACSRGWEGACGGRAAGRRSRPASCSPRPRLPSPPRPAAGCAPPRRPQCERAARLRQPRPLRHGEQRVRVRPRGRPECTRPSAECITFAAAVHRRLLRVCSLLQRADVRSVTRARAAAAAPRRRGPHSRSRAARRRHRRRQRYRRRAGRQPHRRRCPPPRSSSSQSSQRRRRRWPHLPPRRRRPTRPRRSP